MCLGAYTRVVRPWICRRMTWFAAGPWHGQPACKKIHSWASETAWRSFVAKITGMTHDEYKAVPTLYYEQFIARHNEHGDVMLLATKHIWMRWTAKRKRNTLCITWYIKGDNVKALRNRHVRSKPSKTKRTTK